MSEKIDTILIIGGGIAGIQAALDAANAGAKVILVESSPTIGGKMAILDKNFPTLDCSICIEAPKMSEVALHPNIELLTLAEVEKVEGEAGNFEVTIVQMPRFVTDECTRCGECILACPVILKNEFDVGIGARKAIYLPIEQAVPGTYVIDIKNCLNNPPNYLPCNRCIEVCGPACIDFNMKPKIIKRKVGAIIVSVGFDILEPTLLPEYGYGKHPDILTSLELERLLQSSGPTLGEIVKPSNNEKPKKVLFILCVGSRDQRFCRYCSRICCMYTIKEAYQLKDHGIDEVHVAYIDIRAYGKGFDEFFERTKKSGVKFIRTKPSKVIPNGNNIKVKFEDTENGLIKEEEYDMVILAPAIIPSKSTEKLSKILKIEIGPDGFFKTLEEKGEFINSTRDGIYIIGCSSGPKDIADSVLEAGASVSKALLHLNSRSWQTEEEIFEVSPLEFEEEPRIGIFICHCGSNIAGVVNVKELVKFSKSLQYVVHAQDQKYSCAANTLNEITQTIKEKKINRVIVAACSPKTHFSIFQSALKRAGINPFLLEMANIRNMNTWVHKEDKEGALKKAKDMIKMAVLKAYKMKPLKPSKFPVNQDILVIGGGISGMSAASILSKQGYNVYLVEKEKRLGGMLNEIKEIAPLKINSKYLLDKFIKDVYESKVKVYLGTEVKSITGFIGNYEVTFSNGEKINVGAIILATGAKPYNSKEFGYGIYPNVITSLELEKSIDNVKGKNVAIISCIGSRNKIMGCSRFCCQTMINQAIRLKEKGNNVYVLYKDIRTFSRYAEEEYEEACRKGIVFVQYNQDFLPEEIISFNNNVLSLKDELLGREISIPIDLLVLNIGLIGLKDEEIYKQLKVITDESGFILETHPKLGPAETAVRGVFPAGTSQYPKTVKESVIQSLASATKALSIISKNEIETEPFIAIINKDKCTKCLRCASVCPFKAIKGILGKKIELISALCQGCGSCVAECAIEGAITQEYFTDEQILSQIDAALEEEPYNKVLVFACNWCSYAGADLAGILKLQYPSSIRIIRTMCSARVSQKFILYSFFKGAAAVLVTGCYPQDCHYVYANLQTIKRIDRVKRLLEVRRINKDRLQLCWISAAEAKKFAEKAKEMDEIIKKISKEEILNTPSKLKGMIR